MQQLQPNTLLQGGKYKIIKVLGQGGFGITYLAIQSGLERKVAIKEFFMKELCSRDGSTSRVTIGTEGSRETVSRFREKFLKEARNIARLNHSNIVRVIDVFEENGTAYYVMEYAENGSLAEKVKKQGCLPEPIATSYIIQIANALAYIHKQKMNHLDVKPANIMLNEKDEAVLIDFGLSKQYDATTGNQTSTTPVGISEGYAPMEQYMQGGVGVFSPETDVYALGATFFKLLTGTTPPNASFVNNNGVPVEELKAKGVSRKAIDIICKAMEGRKKERLNDVSVFVNAVKKQESKYNVSDDSTLLITEDIVPNNDDADPDLLLSKDDIRQKAMAQYLAKKRADAEKKAIEEEIQRIQMEEEQKRLAEEERRRKEEEERKKKAEEERRKLEEEKMRQEAEEQKRIEEERRKHEEMMLHGIVKDGKVVFSVKGIDFNMIKVKGGTFDMKEEVSCGFLGFSTKEIVQKTTLSDYYIGETQVTQELWKAVMGSNPSCFKGDNLPVEFVTWDDCQAFISKLNSLTGKGFRLPTEAEWEFAARGGKKSRNFIYSGSNDINEVAWYSDNSGGKTHPVATKQANELGIYDMSGNVGEWCSDGYGSYSSGSQTNPTGPTSVTRRVYRGGSWDNSARLCRSSIRNSFASGYRFSNRGLRLCLSEL